jgi:choline dehydrogenase
MSATNATTMTRDSSETSFLRRVLDYPNFAVYPLTMAKKIIFGPDNNDKNRKKASGVVVDTQGDQYVLTATKVVIVSAGAFASPPLLMVSGLGPAAHLEKLGIPVVADRPGVGQNMQDVHLARRTGFRARRRHRWAMPPLPPKPVVSSRIMRRAY